LRKLNFLLEQKQKEEKEGERYEEKNK